ncbi:hypothetical protein RS1P1_31850 [Pseudomonas moraviensis]|nr:hypothetical protein RS1P1_31850 [Pseudomonas moraviensis]
MARELAPAGLRSGPKTGQSVSLRHTEPSNYDDCVAEREQAPSPQVWVARPTGRLWLMKLAPIFGLRTRTYLPPFDSQRMAVAARIMVQDLIDVFRAIEQQGFNAGLMSNKNEYRTDECFSE